MNTSSRASTENSRKLSSGANEAILVPPTSPPEPPHEGEHTSEEQLPSASSSNHMVDLSKVPAHLLWVYIQPW